MLRTVFVFAIAIALALSLVLVLRRRGLGRHWAIPTSIVLLAVGGAYAVDASLRTRDHSRLIARLRSEPLVGAFMSTPRGQAAVDAAIRTTEDYDGVERVLRIAGATYPEVHRMVRLKFGVLDDETTVEVARTIVRELDASIRHGQGCLFRPDQIALGYMSGSPDLAIVVLRAKVDPFARRATRAEVDEIMRPLWPAILARSGVGSIHEGGPEVQCRMGNMVIAALADLPPRTSAPAIRSILRI